MMPVLRVIGLNDIRLKERKETDLDRTTAELAALKSELGSVL